MRACCVFLYLLAATFALSVKSKPHGKHHKTLNVAKDKDIIAEEANEPQALPTLLPLGESGTEQEVEDLSSEDNANANKEIRGIKMPKRSSKTEAVLMSDEELTELLKKEEQEVEERELEEEEEAEVEEGKEQSVEISEDSEKMLNDQLDREDAEEGTDEDGEDAEMLDKEEIDVEMMPLERKVEKVAQTDEQGALFEESDGSAESEIPADLDYAADSGLLQALHTLTPAKHPNSQLLPETEGNEQKTSEEELPAASDDSAEAADGGEMSEHDEDQQATSKDEQGQELDGVTPDPKESADVPMSKLGGKEEEKSRRHSKRKTKKQQRNHMVGKHFPQSEQPQSGQEQSQQESESSSAENTGSKAKRRRAGKWGSIVGMNPVQIRATVDLYPSTRSALAGHVHHPEAPADPCTNFPCKRGKTCKLDADNKPGCVCQQASECPPSVNDFDSVCGTDNKTYDSSCQLFAAKCNLEGTKRGHRLHLDYTGPCKLIPSCLDAELVQFPLRMRDWLKNVLLQLYEHDSATPGFLTAKQRFKVKKIFESERRLHAGNHSAELLAQDFEKNYNMYIYPVHWQFAQLDQHPSDRFLSHSELAPLRVPLVPMEHCTSRFFQECDADKDKQVSFKEWTSCFGIRNEDMDVNQLF
ncbi:SPARC-like protein 1 [Takifugu flavidus]|uniref:SPARC-like protein 1 n=1 Tax=Takifugu flavidus TaxID=433684 RepID=UPI002543FF11|nr:SPARC-like protein 1 [Takifugu flavidus]